MLRADSRPARLPSLATTGRSKACHGVRPGCRVAKLVDLKTLLAGFTFSVPLPLFGHNLWCFPLDRHHIREYVKHPRALFACLLILRRYDRKHRARLKVEVTSRLPFRGKLSPRSGWKVNEISGDFPRSGPARHPLGGFIKEMKVETRLAPSPSHRLGASMEGLIELVAASFARHGIECPVDNSQSARPVSATSVQPTPSAAVHPAETIIATALPEHNFRKDRKVDPAP